MTKKSKELPSVFLTDVSQGFDSDNQHILNFNNEVISTISGCGRYYFTQTYISDKEVNPHINYPEEYFKLKALLEKREELGFMYEKKVSDKKSFIKNAIDSVEV